MMILSDTQVAALLWALTGEGKPPRTPTMVALHKRGLVHIALGEVTADGRWELEQRGLLPKPKSNKQRAKGMSRPERRAIGSRQYRKSLKGKAVIRNRRKGRAA